MIATEHFLLIGLALFCIGVAIVLTRRNAIVLLMGIELMLNAANINLVAFSQYQPYLIQGQFFALFVIVIAAAEAAVALAIVLQVYKHFKTVDVQNMEKPLGFNS
jgi:NADH:ubiquinone oxidoreductase subunit K